MDLHIYRDTVNGKELLGKIEQVEQPGSAAFAYEKSYLSQAESKKQLGISQRLPLSNEPYSVEEFGPFFQGLLPEGEVLGGLALRYQIARNDFLGLIDKLGCESIGALTFISGKETDLESKPSYQALSNETVEAIKRAPFQTVVSETSSTRLSLAGAQMKLAWMLPKGIAVEAADIEDWQIPYGTAPSTHIIKVSRPGEEDIALNECICAALANECGIKAAKATPIPWLPGSIAVERYDRCWIDTNQTEHILRLHQEDFCQALGLYPALKYQPKGIKTSYLALSGNLIEEASSNPSKDQIEFAKRMIFNYAVGNTDAHLKNNSLLYNKSWTGRRLAPLYDTTCIPLTPYSTGMAFRLGEHRELAEINERDIQSIAIDTDIGFESLDKLITEIVSGFESFNGEQLDKALAEMAERIINNARPRLRVLQSAIG